MAIVVRSGGIDLELAEPLPWPSPMQLGYTDPLGVSQDYATLFRTQPAVRKVVSFLARNIAQLGLHAYVREADDGRRRLRPPHPVGKFLARPCPGVTRYRMVDTLVHDLAIYDRFAALKFAGKGPGEVYAVRLPPAAWFPFGADAYGRPKGIRVYGQGEPKEFPLDKVLFLAGYSPRGYGGVPPLETLRVILADELAAQRYRMQLWQRGARISGIISRPKGLGWQSGARDRFLTSWRSAWEGDGTSAGGTPILEDGMEFKEASFSAKDSEYLPGRVFNTTEVATQYHIPPPMVGLLEHATFSNIGEQHKMLYADTLGPRLVELEEELELQLEADLAPGDEWYLEFNIEEKLRGTLEEQAATLQTATGAPWLLRNEARARMNLPAVEGADALIVPLNVLEGGQASPTDSAPPPAGALARELPVAGLKWVTPALGPGSKARRPAILDQLVKRHVEVLTRYFDRQEAVIRSALGADKALEPLSDVWDRDRWDRELKADLLRLGMLAASTAARDLLDDLDPDYAWDDDPMLAYLDREADRVTATTNDRTEAELIEALRDPHPPIHIGALFAAAREVRGPRTAETRVTELAGFGRNEAARATGRTVKTWRTTSSSPRAAHGALDGETVAIGEVFSNGARWPGDASLSADDRAGCRCIVEFTAGD